MVAAIIWALMGCDTSAGVDTGGEGVAAASPTGVGTLVSFTVYTDADCTQLPPRDSLVELDASVACNETPDSSISELSCFSDRITYTNHPNTSDCSANGIPNELFVGVCQEFPGPVPTWKLIEADTYNCITE